MARHRINENGHLMWFESDEEYYEYLEEKERIHQQRIEELKRQKEEEKQGQKALLGCLGIPTILFIIGAIIYAVFFD